MELSSFAWKRLQARSDFNGTIHDFMEEVVWAEEDKAIIARDLIDSLPDGPAGLVICGARTTEEIEILREQNWDALSLYLYSNASLRHKRYVNSGLMTRYGLGYKDLVLRDMREYSWGIAKVPSIEVGWI